MGNQTAKIGLYDESKNLIGYKADTFWTLSKQFGKEHIIIDGKIPENLIEPLSRTLARSESDGLAGRLADILKRQFFQRSETALLGYVLEGSVIPIFTHRLFEDGIEELDSEELTRLNESHCEKQ